MSRSLLRLFVAVTLSSFAIADENTGSIRGAMVTAEMQARYVGEISVAICDGKTGLPLIATTKAPLSKEAISGFDGIWHASGDSAFEFDGVPAGEYRLIAQSWLGTRGIPDARMPSSIAFLHGVSGRVEVKPGETTTLYLPPTGDGMLSVKTTPEADGCLIFISTAPLWAEPVLGFDAWGGEFTTNIIAVTHSSQPHATVYGLPTDRDLHISTFCYDNLPGFGGATVRAGSGATITIPLYGPWSNGHDTPPQRLARLVDYLAKPNVAWDDVLAKSSVEGFHEEAPGFPDERAAWKAALAAGDEKIPVENLGEFAVKDILAADRLCELREFRQRRREHRDSARK